MRDKFFKIIARIVLTSYSLQSLTPLSYACDVDHLPHTYHQHFSSRSKGVIQGPLPIKDASTIKASYLPSFDEIDKAHKIIEQSPSSTFENHQYRIAIKTANEANKTTRFKVSRRSKSSQTSFDTLYTASIDQGQIRPIFNALTGDQEDTFLSLCKGAFLVNYKNDSVVWHIPGFATINILKDGTVFFDQLATSPFQSFYDLVFKTSQDLFIQTLKAQSLTLKSKKTRFSHAVVADHLHITHEAINEGGLRVKHLTGEGHFTNQAYCEFQGTQTEPAVLGVRQITNQKRTPTAEGARIEGTYLHISSNNQSFKNNEGAEVRLSESLSVDQSSTPGISFINEGAFYVKEATINREVSNNGFLASL